MIVASAAASRPGHRASGRFLTEPAAVRWVLTGVALLFLADIVGFRLGRRASHGGSRRRMRAVGFASRA